MKIATAALSLCLLCLTAGAQKIVVSTRFTDVFLATGGVGTHPAYTALARDPGFRREVNGWTQNALVAAGELNVIGRDLDAAGTGVTVKVPPNTVFVRGLVSRADVKRVEHFSTDEYVVSTTAALEFFDLATGEVFYTRALTGQVFREAARGTRLTDSETAGIFRTCLKGTLEALVSQAGEDYRPGVIEGRVVETDGSAAAIVDLGRSDGITQGTALYLYEGAATTPAGLARTSDLQDRLCQADIVVPPPGGAARGWTVRGFGINRRNLQKGATRYLVAGFRTGNPVHLAPEFSVDAQDLGQWLHDGLSQHTSLFMLAPLLVTLDSIGSVRVQEALWEAQEAYSLFGGLARSAVVGRRAFPDVMINGVVTYAQVQHYTTPGADNRILRLGISVEFYDRKTRDFLYSMRHSGRAVEKIVKDGATTYRDVDLSAAFRALCKDVVREATQKIGKHYRPRKSAGSVVEVGADGRLTISMEQQGASRGDLYRATREERLIKGMDGEVLGPLMREYGIVKLLDQQGKETFDGTLLVSDGSTPVQAGDRLEAEGKQSETSGGPLCQVAGWRVQGRVCEEYNSPLPLLTEWLHSALLANGRYRLLPPELRASDASTAEVGLASGQFEARDQREILYQGIRIPEIIVTGRVGLADVTRRVGEFRDVVKLRAGVEITFATAQGDTLANKKLVGTREVEQVKAKGQTMIGTEDLGPEFDGLTENTIQNLVQRMVVELVGDGG